SQAQTQRPSTSRLFPYTTLFRSVVSDLNLERVQFLPDGKGVFKVSGVYEDVVIQGGTYRHKMPANSGIRCRWGTESGPLEVGNPEYLLLALTVGEVNAVHYLAGTAADRGKLHLG